MGILNTQNTILQAVLTRVGRDKLLNDNKSFQITKWAVSDDDVNYNTLTETLSGDVTFSGPVLEPSVNENSSLKYKLLRTVSDYSQYISENVSTTIIPDNEYALKYTKSGSDKFSLSDFNNESIIFSFTLTLNRQTSLSDSFIIDMSNFWKYNNCYFDFNALNPIGFVSSQTISSNYWYIKDSSYTTNGIVKPVIIGISSQYKQPGTVDLSSYQTDFQAQCITFGLKLAKESAINLYEYFSKNFVSGISDTIKISNNDSAIVPQTRYYGINSSYTSIGVNIPINITI